MWDLVIMRLVNCLEQVLAKINNLSDNNRWLIYILILENEIKCA